MKIIIIIIKGERGKKLENKMKISECVKRYIHINVYIYIRSDEQMKNVNTFERETEQKGENGKR